MATSFKYILVRRWAWQTHQVAIGLLQGLLISQGMPYMCTQSRDVQCRLAPSNQPPYYRISSKLNLRHYQAYLELSARSYLELNSHKATARSICYEMQTKLRPLCKRWHMLSLFFTPSFTSFWWHMCILPTPDLTLNLLASAGVSRGMTY